MGTLLTESYKGAVIKYGFAVASGQFVAFVEEDGVQVQTFEGPSDEQVLAVARVFVDARANSPV
jgi:hypothetical protein